MGQAVREGLSRGSAWRRLRPAGLHPTAARRFLGFLRPGPCTSSCRAAVREWVCWVQLRCSRMGARTLCADGSVASVGARGSRADALLHVWVRPGLGRAPGVLVLVGRGVQGCPRCACLLSRARPARSRGGAPLLGVLSVGCSLSLVTLGPSRGVPVRGWCACLCPAAI